MTLKWNSNMSTRQQAERNEFWLDQDSRLFQECYFLEKEINVIDYLIVGLYWVYWVRLYSSFGDYGVKFMKAIHKTNKQKLSRKRKNKTTTQRHMDIQSGFFHNC